jgi:hypothetical protein
MPRSRSRNGRATSSFCTRCAPAPPTAPTACRSRGSPAFRRGGEPRAHRSGCAGKGRPRGRRPPPGRPDRRPAAVRAAPRSAPPPPARSAVEARLRDILPDDLSPREALEHLYELRGASGRLTASDLKYPRGVRGGRGPPASPQSLRRGRRHTDLRRPQQAVVQQEALGHHLDDVARPGPWHRGLEHRLDVAPGRSARPPSGSRW